MKESESMKKMFMSFFLPVVVLLSITVPVTAMATETIVAESIVAEQEIIPFTEMTRVYWRTYNGVLQWRVWSITNGRWMTEWADWNSPA
jgi:hypothetical protein